MRENIKSIGMIIALIIAGVSLPIGIMGFNTQPITYNYYTNNYYTNSTTTIINNNSTTIINNNGTILEHNYTQPLRTEIIDNSFLGNMTIHTFKVCSGYRYNWFFNSTSYRFGYWSQHANFYLYIVADSWLSIFLSGYFAIGFFQNVGSQTNTNYFDIPYNTTWHFIYYQETDTMYGGTDIVSTNYTIIDEIVKF